MLTLLSQVSTLRTFASGMPAATIWSMTTIVTSEPALASTVPSGATASEASVLA